MQYGYSQQDLAFAQEVRDFVAANLNPKITQTVEDGLRLDRPDYVDWYSKLYEKGWITPGWPKEYGGPGWTPLQKLIFDEEMQLAGAPRIIASGINMLGPVLIAFGTPAQKEKYLPAIRKSETWWAQGFSEPGAGSDLASMKTSAVLNGDEFIVNGHKIWTSYAHFCEMLFCLVRTGEGKPQTSISFILIDLKSTGVKVRPIKMLEGGEDLNEVYLDNVRVPKENLIGEINKGWDYAKYLLGHERTGIAGVAPSKFQIARLKKIAKKQIRNGKPLIEDRVFANQIARLEIDLLALENTVLRMLTENPGQPPGNEASMLKVRGTEIRQKIFELLVEAGGIDCLPFDEDFLNLDMAEFMPVEPAHSALAANYLDSRKITIYGGANEVQRNIVAKAVMKL